MSDNTDVDVNILCISIKNVHQTFQIHDCKEIFWAMYHQPSAA